jgi:hypothetical protein
MTYIVVYLWRIESLQHSRILPPREPGHPISGTRKDLGRGCRVLNRSAGRFCTSSRSLRPGRTATVGPAAGSRSQRGFHGQTSPGPNRSSTAASSHRKPFDQPVGHPSPGGTSPAPSSPWVERVISANSRWNMNISRIVWPRKRWPKPTICSFPCHPERRR